MNLNNPKLLYNPRKYYLFSLFGFAVLFFCKIEQSHAQSGIAYELLWESQEIVNFNEKFVLTNNLRDSENLGKNTDGRKKFQIPISHLYSPRPYLSPQGEVILENHFANLQNPFTRSRLYYSRLSYNGNVTLMGLPFETNLFLTTENNTSYSSSFFNVRFNKDIYKQRVLASLEKEKNKYAKKADFYKRKSQYLDSYKQKADQKIKDLKKEKERLKGKQVPDFEGALSDSLNSRKDRYKERLQANDSLKNRDPRNREFPENQTDTLYQDELDSLKGYSDSLTELIQGLYQQYKEDSTKFATYKAMIENPDFSGADTLLGDNKWIGLINSVKDFQLGQAMVYYNPLSLVGTNVRGFDMTLEKDKWTYQVSAGRAANPDDMFNPEQRLSFSKNLIGANISRELSDHSEVSASAFHLADKSSEIEGEKNQVFTLGYKGRFKMLDIEVMSGQSQYSVRSPIFLGAAAKSQERFSNNALDLEVTAKPLKKTQIKAEFKFVGSTYTNVANPFLRRNYSQSQITWEQKWYKSKIKSSVYYRKLSSKSQEFSQVSNDINGLGINVTSSFSKGINFYLMYSPVEQGNNHPDTAFRTFNRSNLISGGISYSKFTKKYLYFSQISYTRSDIWGENLQPIGTNQIQWENNLEFQGKHSLNFGASYFNSAPNLDSLNFISGNLGYMQQVKQNVKAGGMIKAVQYSENSYLYGIQLRYQAPLFKKIQLSFDVELDQVSNWWGVEGKRLAVASNLNLRYRW